MFPMAYGAFEEFQLNADKFSATEKKILRLARSRIRMDEDDMEELAFKFLKIKGEQRNFWKNGRVFLSRTDLTPPLSGEFFIIGFIRLIRLIGLIYLIRLIIGFIRIFRFIRLIYLIRLIISFFFNLIYTN